MVKHYQNRAFSYLLVFAQFSLIALLLWQLYPWSFPFYVLVLQILAVILGLWALKTMHLGHFNIVPDPMPDIELVTTGPYAFIRHPMYASILFFFAPPIFTAGSSLLEWITFIALASTLVLKLMYEEYLLKNTLADYAAYQERSKRIIPFIF